ncbi:unnamed protein product, partial [Gongylonema pulchrum]|uniref:CNNM transmembrane domain-containing protein n=1 Tax=Gongylonema pulchrum TaxID=637853 RepID=A0A183EEP5_9BILA
MKKMTVQMWTSDQSFMVFALVSIAMVLASVTGMILGSTPELQAAATNSSGAASKLDFRPHSILEIVELICIIWFTFEYFARFLVCTEKGKFVLQPLN